MPDAHFYNGPPDDLQPEGRREPEPAQPMCDRCRVQPARVFGAQNLCEICYRARPVAKASAA